MNTAGTLERAHARTRARASYRKILPREEPRAFIASRRVDAESTLRTKVLITYKIRLLYTWKRDEGQRGDGRKGRSRHDSGFSFSFSFFSFSLFFFLSFLFIDNSRAA